MSKVQVKITPSFAGIFNVPDSGWLIFEKDMGEGATISDLLADLALVYGDFGRMVFNPDSGTVSDQVNIILNNTLLPIPDLAQARLKDGDSIILLPVYSGG